MVQLSRPSLRREYGAHRTESVVLLFYLSGESQILCRSQRISWHRNEISQWMVFPQPLGEPNAEDKRLVNLLTGYWTQFAKTGNPNGPGLPQVDGLRSKGGAGL
jgi:para-nitrobenzyl esterase